MPTFTIYFAQVAGPFFIILGVILILRKRTIIDLMPGRQRTVRVSRRALVSPLRSTLGSKRYLLMSPGRLAGPSTEPIGAMR
jgi:hypothetical protein